MFLHCLNHPSLGCFGIIGRPVADEFGEITVDVAIAVTFQKLLEGQGIVLSPLVQSLREHVPATTRYLRSLKAKQYLRDRLHSARWRRAAYREHCRPTVIFFQS